MNDYTDLVRRLRDDHALCVAYNDFGGALVGEAADAIEALTAERDRLQGVVDAIRCGDRDRFASGWHNIGFEAGKSVAQAERDAALAAIPQWIDASSGGEFSVRFWLPDGRILGCILPPFPPVKP